MRMMNPYLVETFVKTTGSHHNVTNDFGNTSTLFSCSKYDAVHEKYIKTLLETQRSSPKPIESLA